VSWLTTTVSRSFFQDHPGEPVPKENFWTLWCNGRLTEEVTPTIRLGATASRLTSAHLHHPHIFLQAGCPSCCPTNSVKALKARALNARDVSWLVKSKPRKHSESIKEGEGDTQTVDG